MSNSNFPPVFDSKTVLNNHIRAKLLHLVPASSSAVEDLATELCEPRSNQEILKLLVDDNLLKNAVINLKNDCITKQRLGGELFYRVSCSETSLCAQITGMLLELDVFTICELLQDANKLESAVLKAKEEFLKYKQKSSKDLIGEELYEIVLQHYPNPDLAARLTGMLLELDLSVLQTLLDNRSELSTRLAVAFEATKTIKDNN